MTAPANDNRSGAQLVPSTDYWGIVNGGEINTDTTEDPGGPVDGFGVRDVYYYWTGLPAGNVYIYVQPRGGIGGAYFEAAAWSGSPTSWVSADSWDGFGFGGAGSQTCRFQVNHRGGDLSLVVYTYVGDSSGDTMTFDFGWGHDLDATSAHWSTNQTESFTSHGPDGGGSDPNSTAGRKVSYTNLVPGLTVPPGEPLCTYENARDGVVDMPSPFTYGCTYIGPGAGDTADAIGSLGAAYGAQGTESVPPNPTATGRVDDVVVTMSVTTIRWGTSNRGPITNELDVEPADFSTYQTANEGADQTFVWGWDYTDASPAWETQNWHFGDYSFTNPLTTVGLVQDSVSPALYALGAGVAWDTVGTVFGAQDRVCFTNGSPTVASYVIPATVSASASISALPDGSTTSVTIADGPTAEALLIESAVDLDGARWHVFALVDQQDLDDIPPSFPDPARGLTSGTARVRDHHQPTAPSFESRLPTWRAFIGFPIEVSTWNIGWMGPSRS